MYTFLNQKLLLVGPCHGLKLSTKKWLVKVPKTGSLKAEVKASKLFKNIDPCACAIRSDNDFFLSIT